MTVSNRWNRIRYSLYEPVYDLIAFPLERGRKRAIQRLDVQPDDHILIIGCGTGLDLKHLPREADVTAIDLTPRMVRRTKQRADALGMNVDTFIEDARSLPVPDDTFDAVLLHLVLTVIPDPEIVVEETKRVLKDSGRVSIFDKFVTAGASPKLVRRTVNPIARLLFADLTRYLEPLVADTGLELGPKERFVFGLYLVTTASPVQRE